MHNESSALPQSLRIAPRRPPVTEITRTLLDYLLSGEVSPGSKIPPERQLAEALGVGRSQVREAIKSLSLLGLLDVRQGDGTYLSQSGSDLLPQVIEWGLLLGQRRIFDLVEARAEIEVLVAGLAAERATEETTARLRKALDALRQAGDDVDRYVEADVALHLEIAAATENETFISLVTSLRSLLGVWAKRVLEHAGETASSFDMHEPIVDAIAGADPDAARAAMRAHMERADRRLRAALDAENASAAPSS
ncbi:FadR/GntR family transcriptional regulator [Patulibacter defluvii]|uniref:FadR/GntR family transcriptional regulator n=1 Tax=Patulibacter defluvii TaxID=3095358 RepID=UPI002A7621A7|nr:FadR/GntR family transcriptional regulator [Patulibacter sp. DM4]